MAEDARWSPFRAKPEEMVHPRAVKASECPSCPSGISPGDRITEVFRAAEGGRKSKAPKRWRHVTCPS